ncbi:MAG: DUF5335 family protein [Acidobacteria bacterium]|nr:DUF5335 family protein [Acidobacteriota bacterium]
MPTREIQRSQWVAFFDSFSRQHLGWLVTLEVFGAEIGAQTEARQLPLKGIIADLENGDNDKIEIMVGKEPHTHLTHAIAAPTHVRLQQTEEGAHQSLDIESASGIITLLRFRSILPPELVDDVAPE